MMMLKLSKCAHSKDTAVWGDYGAILKITTSARIEVMFVSTLDIGIES